MGSTAITGELIWPSQNDLYGANVGGSVGDGVMHYERQRRKLYGSAAGKNNYVLSGGTLPATDPDLIIPVAAGSAIIEGVYCEWPATSVTLPASNTSHLFMKLVFSGTLMTGLEIEDNTSNSPPAASTKLGTATTSGSAITSTTDARILGPGASQVLTSGTTFTWPAGIYRMKVRLFGAGGGGGGGADDTTDGSAAGNGGSTTFGALTANGGGPGQGGLSPATTTYGGQDGTPGTASGGAVNMSGLGMPGGRGGPSESGIPPGAPGAPGGYCEGWITGTPGGTTSYTIGAGGVAGVGAVTPTYDGTAGPAGRIVLEY